VQLKEFCKERNLSTTGKKADLIARLCEDNENTAKNIDSSATASDARTMTDEFDEMCLEDLVDSAIARGIFCIGLTREKILEELRQDIQMTKGIKDDQEPVGRDRGIALSHLLEMKLKNEAAAQPVIPKFITLKISSIGLNPEKFTVGGAPSVTADVIRKLAGDPFADPPKYGTVGESFFQI
jgi:SAP domain